MITFFITLVAILFTLPYVVEKSELQVSLNKGLLVGFAYNKLDFEADGETDRIYQVALGIVIFTFTITRPLGE